MDAKLIQFALGLTNTPFLTALNGAGLALRKFGDFAVESGTWIGEHFWAEIERGSQLDALARRTGIAAGSIYQLQEAFKAADLAQESAVPMLNAFQRSLSGVGDMGQKTSLAFRALGLDIRELRQMDATAAFQQVISSMADLNQSDALKVGKGLFGAGASDAVQLSRSLADFSATMSNTSNAGAVFSQWAAQMNHATMVLGELKRRATEFWIELVGKAAPYLNGLLTEIRDKGIGEAIRDALSIGMEEANRQFQAMMVGWNAMIVAAFKNALSQKRMSGVGNTIAYWIDRAQIRFLEAQRQSLADQYMGKSPTSMSKEELKKQIKQINDQLQGTGTGKGMTGASMDEANAAADASKDYWNAIRDAGKEARDEYMRSLEQNPNQTFEAWRKKYVNENGQGEGGAAGALDISKGKKLGSGGSSPEVDALTRVGAIFGGMGTDYARRTADNTSKMCVLLKQTYDANIKWAQGGGMNARNFSLE